MNRIIHFEIHAKDLDKIQDFYSKVFGWEIKDMGKSFGYYRSIMTGVDKPDSKWTGINGGINPRIGSLPTDGQPINAFICTINVDNVDTYIEKVKEEGGSIAMDKMEVPTVGVLVYCKDPEGNIFGMLESQPQPQQSGQPQPMSM